MDLFDYMRKNTIEQEAPLASRLRPSTLDEVVGQKHIIGKDKLLYRAIKADKLGSLIFYGPPGTGKTTLAKAMRLFLLTVRGAAEERLAYGLWRLTEEEELEAERIVRHVPLATEVSAVHLAGIPVTDSRYAKIDDAPMLIIDDMGCEPATVKHYGTEATPVADAIFRRYDRMQLTIITSNLDDEGIEQRYGARITDRFEEMFDRISFDNESYRR